MPAVKLADIGMTDLAVFNLPAVVRYDREPLRMALLDAVNSTMGWSQNPDQVSWRGNVNRVLHNLFKVEIGRTASFAERSKISKAFTENVKVYFLQNEDTFEIRPGVQSIFGHIEKNKDWKYCIISDYWSEVTHFILQSCGVFSKNKLTITADDAENPEDQLECALNRLEKKNAREANIYMINGDNTLVRSKVIKQITPKFEKGKPNFFYYPRFSQLFKISSYG